MNNAQKYSVLAVSLTQVGEHTSKYAGTLQPPLANMLRSSRHGALSNPGTSVTACPSTLYAKMRTLFTVMEPGGVSLDTTEFVGNVKVAMANL